MSLPVHLRTAEWKDACHRLMNNILAAVQCAERFVVSSASQALSSFCAAALRAQGLACFGWFLRRASACTAVILRLASHARSWAQGPKATCSEHMPLSSRHLKGSIFFRAAASAYNYPSCLPALNGICNCPNVVQEIFVARVLFLSF